MNKMNFVQCLCVGTALLLANLAQAQSTQPCDPRAYIRQGDAAIAASNPSTALDFYTNAQACAAKNRDVGARITIAEKFLGLGKVDSAISALQEAYSDCFKWVGYDEADRSMVNCTYGRSGLQAVINAAQYMLTVLPADSPARRSVASVSQQASQNLQGLNSEFGQGKCPFVLVSGTYNVVVDNYGKRFLSKWALQVTNGKVTGTSTWDCCPGRRIDPLWGSVTGSQVVIERDCRGQGWTEPVCHEVFNGTIERSQIRGTFSGTGSAPGNEWTLR